MQLRHLVLAALLASTACAQPQIRPETPKPTLSLPTALSGKAELLGPTDADYARAAVGSAVRPAGKGGVSDAIVVRMTQDIAVYRMWNGPARKDASGNTNRLGSWWSYEAPRGTVANYRSSYEICLAWNDLRWVATCTLRAGAVVAIGPGQSVSAETCGDPTGKEQFPANARDWQLYIDKPWTRTVELVCPPQSDDYEADPDNIAATRTK